MKPSKFRVLFVLFIIFLIMSGCRAKENPVTPSATQPTSESVPATTNTPPSPTATSYAPGDEILALEGLPFDSFLDESFALILRCDPEWATSEGLAKRVGADESSLTDLSLETILHNQDIYTHILQLLRGYDRTDLDWDEQVSYDAYTWYLEDLIEGQVFMDYDYPINQLTVLGLQYQTQNLFTEYQVVSDMDSAQAYLARLAQVDDKFMQIIAGLERRARAGVIPPQMILDWSLPDIQSMANSSPKMTPYYTAFEQKLLVLSSIPPEDQKKLLLQAETEITSTILPAYQTLADYLVSLRAQAPEAVGVWQYPDGEAYYQWTLSHHTSTDLTADEIHQLGLQELERIQTEMRAEFERLGYSSQASLGDLFNQVAQDSGFLSGQQIVDGYQEIIDKANNQLDQAFDLRPQTELEVRTIQGGTSFYTTPSLDGSRPGVFFAAVSGSEPRYKMPSLAYHEAIPGHHYQISIARDLDLPLFRNVLTFTAYTEGWALYVQRLAQELGWFSEDPLANLGQLQSEAFRAARLVVDTGIHAKRWTFEQAVDFMVENTGQTRRFMEYEVARYIVWPGQATSYYMGMLRLLDIRQQAQEQQGVQFDLKAFHTLVLQSASLPLDILEEVIKRELTLASLEKVNDFPFYTMRFTGDYGFERYLQEKSQALQSTSIHPSSPISNSLFTPKFDSQDWACTVFTASDPHGERLLGRNFDWYRHPVLLLLTNPLTGFASVSMVDLSYLGFDNSIPEGEARQALLYSPFLPFDGLNEHGLAVGMMSVPHSEGSNDPSRPTLNSLEVIRLLLDYAANLDQALDLLSQYNVDFGDGPPVHYLISDASGASAVVEYLDGNIKAIRNQQPWQVSTNFLLNEVSLENTHSVCPRYARVDTTLSQTLGILSKGDAMELLKSVSQSGISATIWSVVYNLTSGEIQVAMDRNYSQVYSYSLNK